MAESGKLVIVSTVIESLHAIFGTLVFLNKNIPLSMGWLGCLLEQGPWFTGSILSNALPDTMCIVPQQVLVGT